MNQTVGVVENDAASVELGKKSLADFKTAKPIIDALLRQWSGVEFVILENRKMRRQRVDLEALRAQGKADAAEKYVGVRVIDNNIQKDIPPYIAYLKQSRRMGVFKPVGAGAAQVGQDAPQIVEDDVTRMIRYPGWELDWIRWVDGAELNGFDWLELLYDDSKPGHIAINHVGAIDLVFDMAVKDIQHSRMVLRRYRPTLVMLDELAQKNGFDEKMVRTIRTKIRESLGSVATEAPDFHQDGNAVHLFKVQYKERGVVFTAWYCKQLEAGWLREPRIFWNGVKQKQVDPLGGLGLVAPGVPVWERVQETEYPYYLLPYRITEDPCIAQTQGRGEMDLHIQEVSCSTWSAFVNQAWESSRTMWSPKDTDPTVGGTAPKQLNVIIKKGAIWDRPMNAFTPPPPDPTLPRALELLETRNADNINQPAWTVNNRQDSRKTAKEVETASAEQAKLSSVQVVVLSTCVLKVLLGAWRIISSQIAQGAIETSIPVELTQVTWSITAAGDIDYIERQETIQKMQQDWPVMQATPAAGIFLEQFLRLRYPNDAERFIAAIKAGDQKKQLIAAMGQLLSTAVTGPDGQLLPDWQPHAQQLQQIAAQAQAALQAP